MEKSKVYFTNMRASEGNNLLQKLKKLIEAAGIADIDFKDKFAAIKIHFGEPGNLSFLRPNFAKVVADEVKALGGRPFLTDCNTLYVGRRKNALDHIDAAYENGFTPFSTGCQVIIADGLKGTDEALVPIEGGTYVKEAKIGQAIMDADIIISLSHFKGHEATGFGGAMKNLGMGCGSRAGKMEQHCSGKPTVNTDTCRSCGKCAKICAHSAITFPNRKAQINHEKCVGCGRCLGSCNFDAIYNGNDSANDELCMKIAEYTKAVVQNRPQFHICIVMDVSPYCDCHAENDTPIIQDVGMFASFDSVALDMACADACNKQPVLPGSKLHENLACGHDHHDTFTSTSPQTNWMVTLEHGEKIGVGTRDYQLIEL
ncbi:MAG: DUF362 domain-containing protein [Oscillospiraceae bacterium]|nr:DUF362 domain-containing protein [Oscillospiraceae bacterium]